MKIIRQGNKYKTYQGTCYYCESVIQASENELKSKEYCIREREYFGRAVCPVCSKEFVLYEKENV